MKAYLLAVCIALTLSAGCDKPEMTRKPITPEDKTIIIGLIPEHQIFDQIERYTPLADYLSKKLGMKIALKVLPRYGNIIDNFVSMKMDGAFFGSFTYSLAHAKLGVEVLARPENLDGISSYYGLIFVRKNSGIKNAEDMQGKRFVFVDKATTAGYLIALHYFKKHGIKNYKTYFKETYFAGTHEDAIYDVLNGKADIGSAKNTVFDRLEDSDKRITKELLMIEKSPEVPENGLAVRKDLDDSIKMKLKSILLDMHKDPEGAGVLKEFGTRRFIETKNSDYGAVVRYAEEIGLDLSTYDYMNE
jgi:phosphonate transport system substrate-binding protein